MMPFHIRPAGPGDAGPLTALARQTFCETFTHYAPQALAAFLDEHYAEPVFAAELADRGNHFYVAESTGELMGYMKFAPFKLPITHDFETVCELHRLYVAKAWHGKKIGAALMERALALAAEQKAQALYLGVWEHNTNAQSFYARYGFAKAGEYDYPPVGETIDREWIMLKTL